VRASFVILGFVVLSGAASANLCEEEFYSDAERLQRIVEGNQGFRTSRRLSETDVAASGTAEASYQTVLGSGFLPNLKKTAASGGTWLDVGIGEGNAARDALVNPEYAKLRFLGVGPFMKPEWVEAWEPLLRDAGARAEVRFDVVEKALAGKRAFADVATDVYGALSYTTEFDRTLFQELDSLKEGGNLFFALQKFVSNEDLYLKIARPDGTAVTLLDFLGSIRGIRVVKIETTGLRSIAVHLERTGDALEIPSLKLSKLNSERNPPRRTYVWDPKAKRIGSP